jgi:hypothetical protein
VPTETDPAVSLRARPKQRRDAFDLSHTHAKPGSHHLEVLGKASWAPLTETFPGVPDSRDVLPPVSLIEVRQSRHGDMLLKPKLGTTEVILQVRDQIIPSPIGIEPRQREAIALPRETDVTADQEAPDVIVELPHSPQGGEPGADESRAPVEVRKQSGHRGRIDLVAERSERVLKRLVVAATKEEHVERLDVPIPQLRPHPLFAHRNGELGERRDVSNDRADVVKLHRGHVTSHERGSYDLPRRDCKPVAIEGTNSFRRLVSDHELKLVTLRRNATARDLGLSAC